VSRDNYPFAAILSPGGREGARAAKDLVKERSEPEISLPFLTGSFGTARKAGAQGLRISGGFGSWVQGFMGEHEW
jgi:hypothetical protein